jgi:threonylcarbamoyladenosine tRNA methylthiotransferase MtaB
MIASDSMGPELVTFGCRLNIAESERMRALAAAAGVRDAVIVNSCAVTVEAERQARQSIRRAHRQRPDQSIVVTGCAATMNPTMFRGMPGVVSVLDNRAKLDPASWRALGGGAHMTVDRASDHTRAFVEIQQGCDHRCTFCIIPYARGPNRSRPVAEIIDAVRHAVTNGSLEVVLTGVDVTAWGEDLPDRPRLGALVRQVLVAVADLPRLRLSSLDAAEIDETLWGVLADEPRLMPHLHLSVQSGDDLVLKQMKRRHGRAQIIETANRAREVRPDLALGADLLVGFPTETVAQFQRTLDLVTDAALDYLHVFSFSPRPLTPAAKLKPLPPETVRARAASLRAAAAARLQHRLEGLVGTSQSVLIERGGAGHAPCFAKVRPSQPVEPGSLVDIHVRGVADGAAFGDLA